MYQWHPVLVGVAWEWPGGWYTCWPGLGDCAMNAEWTRMITINWDPTISSAVSSRLQLPALDYIFVIFTLLEKLLFDSFLKISLFFPYIFWKAYDSIWIWIFVPEHVGGGDYFFIYKYFPPFCKSRTFYHSSLHMPQHLAQGFAYSRCLNNTYFTDH